MELDDEIGAFCTRLSTHYARIHSASKVCMVFTAALPLPIE